MTAHELQEVLIKRRVRGAGGTARRWRAVVGGIRVYDSATHPHCNWSISPSGNAQETAAVEALLDVVRLEHPIVAAAS
jgi:hypothetical protein